MFPFDFTETLRVTFVVMEPYQSQYSNRDSVEFQNFSKSLAEAVNLVFRDLPGTHRASLVRIQWVDHFLCILTTFQLSDEYFIRRINLAFVFFLVKNKTRLKGNWVSIKGLKYTHVFFTDRVENKYMVCLVVNW